MVGGPTVKVGVPPGETGAVAPVAVDVAVALVVVAVPVGVVKLVVVLVLVLVVRFVVGAVGVVALGFACASGLVLGSVEVWPPAVPLADTVTGVTGCAAPDCGTAVETDGAPGQGGQLAT
jgi:hypothetical protein